MNFMSKSMKQRLTAGLFALTAFFAASPALMAAGTEEEATNDPVWVLSYAAFIFFSGVVVILSIVFSRRPDTLLDMEEQKHVGQLRADRHQKRLKEQRLAAMHNQKKKK